MSRPHACECCSTEPEPKKKPDQHNHTDHDHDGHTHGDDGHDHDHGGGEDAGWKGQLPLLSALLILAVMLTLDFGFHFQPSNIIQLLIFGTAYLLAGWEVLRISFKKALHLDFFNEFFLMSVATIGAFAIGSYSEGVAVMVFYSIGEWFQDSAVSNAKRSIKALLDIRPETVNVLRAGSLQTLHSSEVRINEIIQIKAGEKVALDGELLSATGTFNTAAMTGESKPDSKVKGDTVLAGMINLNTVTEVRVLALFKDSKLSKILEMVQDATARKSKTQLFISRFAKVYTPVVFALAVLVVGPPYFFAGHYVFSEWLYRGLVFLVISCPCALVVSIPLGYFGGIGLASKNGILFKGSNFLDVVTTIDTVVMDKTGTLTKGVFNVQKVVAADGDERGLVNLASALESKSTHPIALAITAYSLQLAKNPAKNGRLNEGGGSSADHIGRFVAENVEEVPGKGLRGTVNGREIFCGNIRLLDQFNISYDQAAAEEKDTVVLIAVEGKYAGYLTIADELKEDALQAIKAMHSLNLKTVMLSGDKQAVVDKIAKLLGINQAFGDLLPIHKVQKLEALKNEGRKIAFVGDGINDAPVVALADAGVAMGGLGSDATIETADIVIQNDQPSKIVTAIKIGKITRNIVWQNIALAMGVKILVLSLGAGGIATLWEAVIADVGVALLAILNAVRIQKMKV